jgi:hypothetical protein
MDSPISMRKAEPKDESDFAELFLISAPFFAELFKENLFIASEPFQF